MPGLESPDTIFPELLLKYTPIVFAALVISGALAASMSTGDSQLHAVSTMVSTDIYKTYINKSADDYSQYRIAKLATLAFGFCSVIVALMRPGLISDILALANGGVAALAPAMLGGIYWKKATPQGALSSILIGEAVMLFTTFIVPNPLGLMAGLWGLIAALIVFAAVSLATRPVKTTIDVVDSLNHFFCGRIE